MIKDTTQFRERFKRWLNGEKVYDAGKALPGYEDGKDAEKIYAPNNQLEDIVITPDRQYNQYLNTLPLNQRMTPESEYSSHRYWQLNGKPRDFEEAKKLGMFEFNDKDGRWHASSVQENLDRDVIEWMKPKKHPTAWKELDAYNKNQEFKNRYEVVNDPLRPGYYMYQPRQEHPSLQNDATKVNYTPSVYLGDDETAQKLFRDRFDKEVNALYGVARFLPWVKYATDIADVKGMSPDIDQPDFSDFSGISAPLFDLMADKQRYDNLTNARIGRRINQFMHPKTKQFVSRGFSQNVIDGMNDQYQRTAGKWKTAKKLAPFRFIDLTSDIHQELVNLYKLKESIERENKYTERKALVDPQFKYKKK